MPSSSCMCNLNKLKSMPKTLSVRKSVPARKVSLALLLLAVLQCLEEHRTLHIDIPSCSVVGVI